MEIVQMILTPFIWVYAIAIGLGLNPLVASALTLLAIIFALGVPILIIEGIECWAAGFANWWKNRK